MVSVYRVVPDVDNYQSLQADDIAAVMEYRLDGTPIGDAWAPPNVYVFSPKAKKGDFWGCLFCPAAFAVNTDTTILLNNILEQSCEMLPLQVEDHDELLLWNVTCVVNCLNKKASRHREGLPHWIEEYVFHPHRFDYSLFKIPETSLSEVLCVEGLAAPEDEFKGAVEKHGLKGLKFKKIWTG
jgi:hypothetical protein